MAFGQMAFSQLYGNPLKDPCKTETLRLTMEERWMGRRKRNELNNNIERSQLVNLSSKNEVYECGCAIQGKSSYFLC